MGQPGTVDVDLGALRAVAQQFDDAAASVEDIVRHHLAALSFDGAAGGRAHVQHADAIHVALTELAAGMSGWSRACAEIAIALRDGVTRYADAEAAGSERLG
ncbi:MAG: type VII secretion target [Mycobacterium sp.]